MSNIFKKRSVIICAGILSLVLAILVMGFVLFLNRPAEKEGKDQVIIVREGMNLKEVAGELYSNNIISSKTPFMLWARIMGYSRKIKSGEYLLSPRITPLKVMEILTRGVIITHSITVPEGFTRKQIAQLLSDKDLVDKKQFLELTDNPDLLKKYGVTGPSLEGYLYPDTYRFGRGLSAGSIIESMVSRFFSVVEPFKESIEKSGMTLPEIVTLASIVEKETGKDEERPIIASVFLNRLKKRMRLESDPTVIYGINEFNGNLTRKDLSAKTPYNTYVIRGLPPGPIACPGFEAIKAVLFPADTKYLFFVSKNDGSHHFSQTLQEHNNAVILYQKRGRRSKGRS